MARIFFRWGALLTVLLSVAGCDALLLDRIDCLDSPVFSPLTTPPSAQDVDEWCRSGFNPDHWATFTMAPQDLPAFEAATGLSGWTATAPEDTRFDDEAARATSLLYARGGSPGATIIEALIDTSDPARYRVYYYAVFID